MSTLENFGIPMSKRGGMLMPQAQFRFRLALRSPAIDAHPEGYEALRQQVESFRVDYVKRTLSVVFREGVTGIVDDLLLLLNDGGVSAIYETVTADDEVTTRTLIGPLVCQSHVVEHDYASSQPVQHRLEFEFLRRQRVDPKIDLKKDA